MQTVAVILLAALFSACATPGGDYCDPAKPGFIRGLQCSSGGYDRYINNVERVRDQKKAENASLQDTRQELIKRKEEKEKEYASLKYQLDTLNIEIQVLNNDIDRLTEEQSRGRQQTEQIRARLLNVSTMLDRLAATYESISYGIENNKAYYQQVSQLRVAAQDARTLAERIRGFLIDLIVPNVWDFIPMRKNLKIALKILEVGWAVYTNFVRA